MDLVKRMVSSLPPEKQEGTEYGVREGTDGSPWFYAMKGARWVGEDLPGSGAVKSVGVPSGI
ncbi:MAG: hypothetical protein JRI23_17330 [Deltaproteobacteria bacterium]|nr:hypothetical protein [Deltaproteobacteria bacterium]MBW2533581.1 hypothetical protein [Deltaproteobacteria bacterium]